jgi:hypothetical protein
MISAIEEALRTKQIKMHSTRFLHELKTFVWINTGISIKAQALNDKFNDDLVMSLAVGVFARNTTLRWQGLDTETLNIIMDSMSVSKASSSGRTESISIHQETERKKHQQYKVPGLEEDLSWLVNNL